MYSHLILASIEEVSGGYTITKCYYCSLLHQWPNAWRMIGE